VELQEPTERLRLFIAISLPDAVKRRIEETQRQLRGAVGETAVRWTPPEQLHLTLRFMGNVDAAKLEDLQARLVQSCATTGPLRLQARGVGFFPVRGLPRVVWVGIEDPEGKLPVLVSTLERSTAAYSSEPAGKKFTGHITLGRVRTIGQGQARLLTTEAAALGSGELGEWVAKEIDLMRSELSSTGAQHTRVATFPL
jgi:RNA 2',3'-cyclic 3'-phosphodiesterase